MTTPIWTEEYLNQLVQDANDDIVASVDCIFFRFSLTVIAGQSVYILPSFVRKIQRITWKGIPLHPLTPSEMAALSPATAVADGSNKIEAPTGRPYYYTRQPTNYRAVRFLPTPPEDISVDDSEINSYNGISTKVIISCFRSVDASSDVSSLPSYIARRTQKAWVLSRAFLREGKGQNLKASEYFRYKYEFLVSQWKDINAGIYVAKTRQFGDLQDFLGLRKPGRPVLPPDFEGYRF